jgi:hypothetical protein
MLLAGDLEHDFTHVPLVAGQGQPPADDVGEFLAKLQAPLPDRLVADLDISKSKHLLDHPKAQRKAVARVKGLGRARHVGLIPDPRSSGNPARRQLDGAWPPWSDALHQAPLTGVCNCIMIYSSLWAVSLS